MSFCINPTCSDPQNSDDRHFCQACGSELLLQLQYRVVSQLGQGGFGRTYEIKSGNISKVLKVLIVNLPKHVQLFKREAEVLQQLHTPGIPKVESDGYFTIYPRDSQQPLHCLVMEKIAGLNLRQYIQQLGRPIDSKTACRWLTELVTILQQVHNAGILHRDIKPQNIIFQPDAKLALIDFGAVKEEADETEVATAASSGSGTELVTEAKGGTRISSTGYTPHEQLNGQALPQSDFFALGRTFVYLLTGKEPSQCTYDAFKDELRWREHAPGVSPQFADLVDQMIATPVRQRPADTQAILQKLQQIQKPENSPSNSTSNESDPVQPPDQTKDSQKPIPGGDVEVRLIVSSHEAMSGTQKKISVTKLALDANNMSRTQETKSLTVSISPGTADGTRLRLAGQGHAGRYGGAAGDAYAVVTIDRASPAPPAHPTEPKRSSAAPKVLGSVLSGVVLLSIAYINHVNSNSDSGGAISPSGSSPVLTSHGSAQASCGDGGNRYQVLIRYSPDDLNKVKASYCGDAWRKGDLIQVATFSSESEAIAFRDQIANEFRWAMQSGN